MKYHGIVISDLHFGAMSVETQMKEIREIFLYYIETMKRVHFIILDGDYFDHEMKANDDVVRLATLFMHYLVDFAIRNHTIIRVVYGTESHEVNQYKLFYAYEQNTNLDFKIIYKVTEEELFPNFRILYLPEERIEDKREYYKEYFDKEGYYDYIFGHGIINNLMNLPAHYMKKLTGKKERHQVPVFEPSELLHCCKGQVYFGHYHIHKEYLDKICYVGSFSRWKFGEEEPKGFYHIIYDKDSKTYENKFIENCNTEKYTTFRYHDEIPPYDSLTSLLKKIDKQIEVEDASHIRLIFTLDCEDDNVYDLYYQSIKDYFIERKHIKLDISNSKKEETHTTVEGERNKELKEKFHYLLDSNLTMEEKIMLYAKNRYSVKMSLDMIEDYFDVYIRETKDSEVLRKYESEEEEILEIEPDEVEEGLVLFSSESE